MVRSSHEKGRWEKTDLKVFEYIKTLTCSIAIAKGSMDADLRRWFKKRLNRNAICSWLCGIHLRILLHFPFAADDVAVLEYPLLLLGRLKIANFSILDRLTDAIHKTVASRCSQLD